ncbi:MAG: helix-turn-helix domain-containing protein [Chloroflexi bacterium]|nr:MAG: helix-turn-helix domain-containing protein [Chloroflexota bacterium]
MAEVIIVRMERFGHVIRIGLCLASSDPFWVLVNEAAIRAAESRQVDLLQLTRESAQPSAEEQLLLVEEVLAQELDALVIDHLNRSIAHALLDRGTPVIFTIESSLIHPLTASPKGLYQCAYTLGEVLAEKLRGRGRVLMVGGLTTGWDYGRSRIQGMEDSLRPYPDMSIVHIPAPWESDQAYEYLEEAMVDVEGEVDAVFGLSDTLAVAALAAGRRLGCVGDDTLVVGINGDPLALAAIHAGTMYATVETSAADFGCRVIELAVRAAQGETIPDHFPYKTRLVTAENVAEVAIEKVTDMARIPNRLMSANRQLEAQRLRQMETSLSLNRRMGTLLDHQELRHELANIIRINYGYDRFQIFLWSDARKEFILDRGAESEEESIRIPLEESGLLGYTLLANKPIFIPDMHHSQRFPPDPHWPNTHSRVILPIRQGEKTVGLLDLHSETSTQHTRQDLIGLQVLADQLGIAMRNAQLYRAAVKASARAERASQLKTRLLANVSHELRTPLNVILGYSQRLLAQAQTDGGASAHTLQRDMRYIYSSAEHLMHLINDLLDVSRAEIGELEIFPETIDTRRFLEEVFLHYAQSRQMGGAGRRHQVEWRLNLPRRLPVIQADPLRLRQILLNLLSNADKFTREGYVQLEAEVRDGQLHIMVKDTGCGMGEEQQRQVTEAFATTLFESKPGQGIGLGLRITQELVHLHQGYMEVESEPGQGSIFHVFLPLPEPGLLSRPAPAVGRSPLIPAEDFPPLPSERFLPAHPNPLISQATTYIHRHYAEAITRGEIAAYVGVSETYLTRVFRKELGESLWQYITRYRVSQAKQLLQHSARSISDIAGAVGYNDAAYFSNVFKKETGLSPREFREQARRAYGIKQRKRT